MTGRTTRRTLHRFWMGGLVALALVLAACSTESGPRNGQNSLRPKGTVRRGDRHLFTPIFWVSVAVGIFILGAVVFIAIRFRQGKKDVDERPKQTHGNTPLEIGWTLVPALILAVIAVPTVSTDLQPHRGPRGPDRGHRHRQAVVVAVRLPAERRRPRRSSPRTTCTSRPGATWTSTSARAPRPCPTGSRAVRAAT